MTGWFRIDEYRGVYIINISGRNLIINRKVNNMYCSLKFYDMTALSKFIVFCLYLAICFNNSTYEIIFWNPLSKRDQDHMWKIINVTRFLVLNKIEELYNNNSLVNNSKKIYLVNIHVHNKGIYCVNFRAVHPSRS